LRGKRLLAAHLLPVTPETAPQVLQLSPSCQSSTPGMPVSFLARPGRPSTSTASRSPPWGKSSRPGPGRAAASATGPGSAGGRDGCRRARGPAAGRGRRRRDTASWVGPRKGPARRARSRRWPMPAGAMTRSDKALVLFLRVLGVGSLLALVPCSSPSRGWPPPTAGSAWARCRRPRRASWTWGHFSGPSRGRRRGTNRTGVRSRERSWVSGGRRSPRLLPLAPGPRPHRRGRERNPFTAAPQAPPGRSGPRPR
jgi:hypothetical protein